MESLQERQPSSSASAVTLSKLRFFVQQRGKTSISDFDLPSPSSDDAVDLVLFREGGRMKICRQPESLEDLPERVYLFLSRSTLSMK